MKTLEEVLKKYEGKINTEGNLGMQVGSGWSELIDVLIGDLLKLEWDGDICQIKEKFGGLRFYIGAGNEAIFNRINETERESFRICELCGKPGKRTEVRCWVRTLCSECKEKEVIK